MQSFLFDIIEEDNNTDSDKKVCIKCNRSLALSAFSKRGGENYLRTECKECLRKQIALTNQLKKIYGLPPTDYICPICEKSGENVIGGPRQRNGKKRNPTPWVVDHDHKTKEFRGWLCHKCNRGLGTFDDNIDMLLRAINYLSREDV